jgi:hypothetical protein
MERIGDELLWPLSMPCRITNDAEVPIAYYGTSNIGRMKTIYRRGLGNRYGSTMQAISGVHYNYSLPDAFWPLYRELEGDQSGLGYPLGCWSRATSGVWTGCFCICSVPRRHSARASCKAANRGSMSWIPQPFMALGPPPCA